MKKLTIVLLALLIAGSAFAAKVDEGNPTPRFAGTMDLKRDASITFTDFAACGDEFFLIDEDPVTGSVIGASGDFVMNEDGDGLNWISDLTLLVANADMSVILIQLGGFTDYSATYRFGWPFGDDTPAGPGGGIVPFGENIDITGYYLFLGCGWASGGCNTWTGSIYLEGDVVDNEDSSFGSVKALFR